MKNDCLLIGITGLAGSGKDTVAKYLKSFLIKEMNEKIVILPMAKQLKEMCINYFGLTKYQVYTQEGKKEFLSDYNMTVREFLQKLGTDALRDIISPNIHILMHKNKIKKDNIKICIVPDVRFENEFNYIKENNNITIFIYGRGGLKNIESKHKSENLHWTNKYNFQYYIDNSHSKKILKNKVFNISQYILKRIKGEFNK